MLFKKDDEYLIGFEMGDGRINSSVNCRAIDECQGTVLRYLDMLQDLKESGWTQITPPSLEDATGDELLVCRNGNYCRLLGRIGGYGELATFAVSGISKNPDSHVLKKAAVPHTAYELKERGYAFADIKDTEKEARKAELIRELTEMGAVKDGKVIE